VEETTRSDKAEFIRLKYKYRRLIMAGKINLPFREASLLIGPDCAYHLFSTLEFENPKPPAEGSTKDDEDRPQMPLHPYLKR
jgi:hypothetical protein